MQGSPEAMAISSMAQGLTTTLSKINELRQEKKLQSNNASSYYRQSMLYERQGDFMMTSAARYASMGPMFVAMGKANAKNERIRSSKVQFFIDSSQSEAIRETQQKVGEGLSEFAANGVMVESRDGSAVAMWEQDEAADNAYQQILIAQQGQDQIWEYLMAANQREAEGWAQAADAYSRASDAAGSAYAGYLQSYESRKAGDAAAKAARKAKRAATGAKMDFLIGGPNNLGIGEQVAYW